jgi:hypothetical protein
MKIGLAAALATFAVVATALAAAPTIHVSPSTVHAGKRVRVSGSIGSGCAAGDQVTLISHAFSRRHEFAGVPAVFARVNTSGGYAVSTLIPKSRHGRYSITGRCGGANLAVTAHLRVLAAAAGGGY